MPISYRVDCVRYADRDIMVVHGIAFYCSTGTNTGGHLQGTWFPMLGITHQNLDDCGVPKALMWPKYDRIVHHNIFEKPTPEAFMNTFDIKSNSDLSIGEIYERCRTRDMEKLPLFLYTDFMQSRDIEAELSLLSREARGLVLDELLPDKKAEILDRFLHERLLAISASIGGGVWSTENGLKTKEILMNNYPEYFTYSIIPRMISLNTSIDDNRWGLKSKRIADQQQNDCRQINLWIKSKNGYLNDGDFSAFVERVEHPERYPLVMVKNKFKDEITQHKSENLEVYDQKRVNP